MTRLPVIVGFGGVGPAGRSSFHHAYHRIIWESIDSARRQRTVTALAAMMNLGAVKNGQLCRPDGSPFDAAAVAAGEAQVLGGTRIRRLEQERFDPDQVTGNAVLSVLGEGGNVITVASRDLPDPLPPGWQVLHSNDGKVSVFPSSPQTSWCSLPCVDDSIPPTAVS